MDLGGKNRKIVKIWLILCYINLVPDRADKEVTYMKKSTYQNALNLILDGNFLNAEEYLRKEFEQEPDSTEKIQEMFKAARERWKSGNIFPSMVIFTYWRALQISDQKKNVYHFFWIIYDLIKYAVQSKNEKEYIPLDVYVETAITCANFLNCRNDYVLNWHTLLQMLLLGYNAPELPDYLLKKYIDSLPIDYFHKKNQGNKKMYLSQYESCLSNIAKAYIRKQQYAEAYTAVETALRLRKSWYLLQQRGFLANLLDRQEEALYWLFRALQYFNSDWKFSVRLLHESLQLLLEFNLNDVCKLGYPIYEKICQSQNWVTDENIFIEDIIPLQAQENIEEAYRRFLNAYKDALQNLLNPKLYRGRVISIDQSQGLLLDLFSNARIPFSKANLFDLKINVGDEILYLRSDTITGVKDSIDTVEFIFSKDNIRKESIPQKEILTEKTFDFSVSDYDSGTEWVRTRCSKCHAEITVRKRTLRKRGEAHILCKPCFAAENILTPHGDPYYGLESLLTKIRDEHTMFDIHAKS